MKIFRQISTLFGVIPHLVRVFLQTCRVAWRIGRLPRPIITIFGGGRLALRSMYIQQAHMLARKLAEANMSILTGGGPGIMEAATRGALHPQDGIPHTLGIRLSGLTEEWVTGIPEECYVMVDYLFARKYMLMRYSEAFVIFPGGLGTMDELTELLTLIKTNQLPCAPIILVGSLYWRLFLDWVDLARREGLVTDDAANLITVTDDIDHVVTCIKAHCAHLTKCPKR